MPTNLLHHGSQNRIQKTSRNMAARKGPRLYKKQSGTQREKKHGLTLTLMLVRRKSACKTSAGSSKILRWLADPTFGCVNLLIYPSLQHAIEGVGRPGGRRKKMQEHNETMVTRCYKQSNLLTRKCLRYFLTLMKISKRLGASRKSFVATR